MREEEKKRSSQDSSFKKFMKKRWAFPAIYIASAAIILTGVLWYQTSDNATDTDSYDYEATDITGKKYDEPALEVNRSMENFVMPVKDPDSAVIQKQFYDYDGKAEEQEAALVFYNNTYHPNTGIDIATKDGESFNVLAALSGKVTKVEEDSLLGNVIEVEHDKGIVTQYQSVTDMNVKVGDQVEQGDVLAKAGESLFNEEAGVHVHFEIRKDGMPVNPLDFFNKPLSSLQELDTADKADAEENSGATEENDEAAPSEDKSSEESADENAGNTEEDESADKEEDPAGTSEDEGQTDDQVEEDTATESTDA
ncbi:MULTISPECIES: M23 family metallopeptidase [unclassified Cytobacillus]|uniref:M23 family metallopeptidase n=1 Tax=unclassified Cytobacillus TaxID=2675268 RepID=UPI00135C3C55|nr:M23 family metallopeptidase [Cytobacillus sp. AMY 15.2]KAF0819746.1 Stage II sporulation protein related to metaloproteases (SpoIIQ) [Bacillus sp. ZZV12-4809]MCM3090784.1 peptidoglycan DD-metalloendopeptidase family protein [Cytobacillus sp. AMY 15.2]